MDNPRAAVLLRGLVTLLIALTLSACDAPEPVTSLSLREALSVDTTGFDRAEPGYRIQFPRDHGAHPGFYLEWWYLTGNLQGPEGRPLGYQFTIFRNALSPPQARAPSAGKWTTNQLYSAHLAISDPNNDSFVSEERFSRGALGLACGCVDSTGVRVWIENWRMEGPEDLSELRLRAEGQSIGLNLTLRPEKPVFLQGEAGYSAKGNQEGQASHYYSISRLRTTGTIRSGAETIAVTGDSWFDREWSTSLLAPDQRGWDWFSIQLADGRDLMLFRLRSDGGEDYMDGSLIGPGGEKLAFSTAGTRMTPVRVWRSPETGSEYPVAWSLEIPDLDVRLDVEAQMDRQELKTRVPYWEGMIRVSGEGPTGRLTGRGFLEMTGYGQ
ncbi:MAG: putative secreted hydrolase [Rhodothermales bacterium]